MEGFVVALLLVVLVLWLVKEILALAQLPEPASRVVWVIAVVVAILWLIRGI